MNSLATVVIPQENQVDHPAEKTEQLLSEIKLLNKYILSTINDVRSCKKECKETAKIIKEFNAPFRENS